MPIKIVTMFQATTGQSATAVTGTNIVITMPQFPVIKYVGRQHSGSWTEMMWWDSDDLAGAITALTQGSGGLPAYFPSRAALLPQNAAIIGARFYSGGAGKGQTRAYAYAGQGTYPNDIPQMALLIKAGPSAWPVVRTFSARCIPDQFVLQGEFSPTPAYANLIATYFQALGNFSFYGRDTTAPVAKVVSITGVAQAGPPAIPIGTVSVDQPVQPFAVGQMAIISRTVDFNGISQSITKKITGIGPQAWMFQLENWTLGQCTGGSVTVKLPKALYAMNPANTGVSRVVVRKIGRPIEVYHGRRSKRKVKQVA